MPDTKECLLTTVSNAAVCLAAINAQLNGAPGAIPPECAQFTLDLGDPNDGVATVILTVPARKESPEK